MSHIVLCEKSDQAHSLRAAVGAKYGQIYPASGHLYTLAPPEHYSTAWADRKAFETYRPAKWVKIPTPGNDENHQKRLDHARSAIQSALKTASRVYIATDCDREGEVIGREILDQHNYRGEVYRVIFNADDVESLREAFANAVPIQTREAIYQAGLARERADFIWNLSLTRAVSAALIPRTHSGVIGIGRVKTPTLGIVCRKEYQVAAWKPSEAHVIALTLDTPAGEIRLISAAEQIFPTKAQAAAAAEGLAGTQALLGVETSRRRQGPPKPPDLTLLQTSASKWGWPADKTLEVGQALYSTHKIMTYVRASTRYYPEPAIETVPAMLTHLRALPAFSDAIPASPTIRRGKSGIFSDEGLAGESHYGIMPNAKTLANLPAILPQLSADEARLFELVCRLFLQSVMPDREYDARKITTEIAGLTYAATVQHTVFPGWTSLQAKEPITADDDVEAEVAGAIPPGSYRIIKAEPRPRQATPPKRYTQGTLIAAMLNAAQFVKDEARRERLKDAKGIGTVATRDDVIRGLINQSQMAEAKTTLAPTKPGLDLFNTLYKIDPCLVDPGTTAEWELLIDEIARGQLALETFLDQIEAETKRLIVIIRTETPDAKYGEPLKVTDKMARRIETLQVKHRQFAPPGWRDNYAIASAFLDQFGKSNEK